MQGRGSESRKTRIETQLARQQVAENVLTVVEVNPEKQGLKHGYHWRLHAHYNRRGSESRKTRIETLCHAVLPRPGETIVVEVNPEKQGLKRHCSSQVSSADPAVSWK